MYSSLSMHVKQHKHVIQIYFAQPSTDINLTDMKGVIECITHPPVSLPLLQADGLGSVPGGKWRGSIRID